MSYYICKYYSVNSVNVLKDEIAIFNLSNLSFSPNHFQITCLLEYFSKSKIKDW